MKILWLLNDTKEVKDFKAYDFIISFGYRYLIPDEILREYPNRVINVHIAALPWNRGADPNFWSHYDNTPSGVTIHYVDSGIDTGPIIVQKILRFKDETTLRESYDALIRTGWWLLFTNFDLILKGVIKPIKQVHYVKDGLGKINSLPKGWDTTIGFVRKMKHATVN